jgi:hypothetical protein
MMRTVTEEASCFIRFMALSFMKSYVLFLKIGLIRLNEGTCKIIRFAVEEEMVLALLVSIVDVQLSVSCNCATLCLAVCVHHQIFVLQSVATLFMYTTTTTLLHHYSFT